MLRPMQLIMFCFFPLMYKDGTSAAQKAMSVILVAGILSTVHFVGHLSWTVEQIVSYLDLLQTFLIYGKMHFKYMVHYIVAILTSTDACTC